MRELSPKARELSRYRLEKAEQDLLAAKTLFQVKDYASANNRSYYSIFHAVRAVLAMDGFDSKKHGIIIGEFRNRS